MGNQLKTVHITLTPRIAELLADEVSSGRFANISEAIRNAAWKTFAEEPLADLENALAMLDASKTKAPASEKIVSEVRATRRAARFRRASNMAS